MASLPPNCPPDGIGLAKYYFTGPAGECAKQASFFEDKNILSLGFGYVVVVGIGLFFSVFTALLVWLEERYLKTVASSEWFNTAGRSVKTGLIASVIVSQWTWAATILQSANVAWQYGVSGPFWYASGATIQVLLFGVMAIEIKRKAPTAHTICEIIRARWGGVAHKVFLCFCFLTNCIVSSMLLLGGSSVVNALTGMDIYLASFLIPAGIVIYTLHGGIKATFLSAYTHSIVIHVALVMFIWIVYATDSDLGSPKAVWKALKDVAGKDRDCSIIPAGQSCGPVKGNYNGTYLTMLSNGGLIFGIINIVGNFGTVFVDQGYWQSAIAARPSSSHKGYLLGGLVWFAVPFSLASSLGLAAVALDLPLTSSEANEGLVPPAAAVHLLGKGGAGLLLIMLFMAVTSAGSSELIAVSSLITYDLYRTYINPKATGKQILTVSRYGVLFFGVFMGVLAICLHKAGVSLGWMYLAMGVFIGSAVIPVALLLLWKKANAVGAMAGAIIGCVCGVITWLVVAQVHGGTLDLYTTGKNGPMLAGNLTSILSSGIIHITLSILYPEDYDWESTRNISMVESDTNADLPDDEYNVDKLNHAKWWIIKWGCGFTFLMLVIWPVATCPAREFNLGYFTFWVVIVLAWGTIASIVIIVLPVYESWESITFIISGLFTNDIMYRKIDSLDAKIDAILQSNPEYATDINKAKGLSSPPQM